MTDRTPTGDLRERLAEALHCPTCNAPPGTTCLRARDDNPQPHMTRVQRADAILPVVEDETAALRQRAEEAEAKVAALMDERGAEQIDRIQAERDALPKDERARLDAADAPMLRIQLAGMARQVAEAKAEAERTATAAAREIWVKMGFDTILDWKQRAEEAERQRDDALAERDDYATRLRLADAAYRELLGEVDEQRRRAVEALAAVQRVRDLHQPTQGMGFDCDEDDTPGSYGDIAQVCTSCGTADEYGVRWPCPTITALDAKESDRD